ncbi:MAG: ribonuclease H-like domain-containing protein [Candidatus Diapherotrites archaeon]|nr:ribonuclease H-like domain-containing protein [Candidatus Diapherotrites archaeon]
MKLYLDIETTGLSATDNSLTVLGALRGDTFHQLVQGETLSRQKTHELFEDITEVVSFNGIRFDVPFLCKTFPTLQVPSLHKDLMYLGWQIGLKGGLKSVECQLGLTRECDVKNGYEAVILWQKHLKGSRDALQRLLAYNREDVLNLPVLEEKLEARKRILAKNAQK